MSTGDPTSIRAANWPTRPEQTASLVRYLATGLLFESYLALQNWRARHGLAQSSSASIDVSQIVSEPVHDADAPHPTELTA